MRSGRRHRPGRLTAQRARERVGAVLLFDKNVSSCRGRGAAITRDEKIPAEGEVTEALPNATFRVVLDGGHETLGYVAGKMRRNRVRVLPGDRVTIELSPYDLKRGRIVYRHRAHERARAA